ncbi:MAG: FkbM family methyltransferase [Mesorhizobium sp.]|nr:MAG: FkbM family methyltransferase [Mesorhizobium sp.]
MRSVLNTIKFIVAHPLCSGRPLSALWRYVRWQAESSIRHELEFQWIAGAKLVVRKGMTGATGNIYCGLHEFSDMAFVLHFLQPLDNFVDVGANVGSYSVLASAVCGARTVALEPDPTTIEFLTRNVNVNRIQSRVTIIDAALGATQGTADFTIGRDTRNKMAKADERETRVVRVNTLDEIVRDAAPILVKIDVEGFEADVIAGAKNTLGRPELMAILIETVDDDVRHTLNSHGFFEVHYEPRSRVLSQTEDQAGRGANFLFVRSIEACTERVKRAPPRQILHQLI